MNLADLGDEQLAKIIRRKPSSDASLIFSLLGSFFLLASFPIRWSIEIVLISIPVAAAISFGISGIVAIWWYRRSTRRVAEAQLLFNERMKATKAIQREKHLEKLRGQMKNQ